MKKNSKKQAAKRGKGTEIESNATSAAKWPDFAARAKKIFGDRVLNAVYDFLQYRHREWELAMETDSPSPKKTGLEQARGLARRRRSRSKG